MKLVLIAADSVDEPAREHDARGLVWSSPSENASNLRQMIEHLGEDSPCVPRSGRRLDTPSVAADSGT
jgi:hypothetical protein